jgi:hypothetical protein
MCMQCVANSAPYVVGAVGGLRIMSRRAVRQRGKGDQTTAPPAVPPARMSRPSASVRKSRRPALSTTSV